MAVVVTILIRILGKVKNPTTKQFNMPGMRADRFGNPWVFCLCVDQGGGI